MIGHINFSALVPMLLLCIHISRATPITYQPLVSDIERRAIQAKAIEASHVVSSSLILEWLKERSHEGLSIRHIPDDSVLEHLQVLKRNLENAESSVGSNFDLDFSNLELQSGTMIVTEYHISDDAYDEAIIDLAQQGKFAPKALNDNFRHSSTSTVSLNPNALKTVKLPKGRNNGDLRYRSSEKIRRNTGWFCKNSSVARHFGVRFIGFFACAGAEFKWKIGEKLIISLRQRTVGKHGSDALKTWVAKGGTWLRENPETAGLIKMGIPGALCSGLLSTWAEITYCLEEAIGSETMSESESSLFPGITSDQTNTHHRRSPDGPIIILEIRSSVDQRGASIRVYHP